MRLNPTIFVIISFFGAIGILLIAVMLPIEAQSDSEMTKFENSQMGLSFQIPSEWNSTSSEPEFEPQLCEYNACTVVFINENLTSHELPHFCNCSSKQIKWFCLYLDEFCNCNSLEDFVKFRYNRDWKNLIFINDNQTTIQDNRSAWNIELKSNSDNTDFMMF